jgi:DNA polymerase III subunit epsilon
VADIPLDGHHDALIDARAAAHLLRHYLQLAHPHSPWQSELHAAATATWPTPHDTGISWVQRGVSAEREHHFLARILDRLPHATHPAQADSYLALLDQVLLDHHISTAEADALVELSGTLGLSRTDLDRLHRDYLGAIAHAALADGIVTAAERHEIELVADLLHLPPTAVDDALTGTRATHDAERPTRFQPQPGDLVVFTGEMDGGREAWEERARQASYLPHPTVTKKVRLVIAADPDTLSGKARKARAYGIPIVTPDAFARMLSRG